MSSFARRIERQVCKSNPRPAKDKDGVIIVSCGEPRRKFYGGRGSQLGVTNPKDKALIARLKREKRNADRAEQA